MCPQGRIPAPQGRDRLCCFNAGYGGVRPLSRVCNPQPDHKRFHRHFCIVLSRNRMDDCPAKRGRLRIFEKLAFLVALCLCAPFAILTFQLAVGLPPLFVSAVPFKGPVLIAIYVFTTVLALAAIGDARVAFAGGLSGVPRISRHLWRMCLGLTLAAGSGFTNGFARLLPGPYHVPTSFFLPQFLPLGLIIFWMIRVRSAGWRQSYAVAVP